MTVTDAHTLTDSHVVTVSEASPGVLRAVINNPPYNLFDPTVFAGLRLLRDYVDDDRNSVSVVILESANPDFFIAHLDFATLTTIPDIPGAASIIGEWPDFAHWLSSCRALTIAKIRGRARGIGNELACACDLRFASAENSRLCQIEVGFGVLPGGGALEWLPRHVGRARALEIVLSAKDYDAVTAERYGWINRAVPDEKLDACVDQLARRVAAFNPASTATVKQLINQRSAPPSTADYADSFAAILQLSATAAAQGIQKRLRARAGGTLGPVETDLPALYDPTAQQAPLAGEVAP